VGFTAFAVIATCSGIYELIEWLAAIVVDPHAGNAFLGTQGDEFDSQKDHALALAGAVAALILTRLAEKTALRSTATARARASHARALHT
jgi:putative membrane protein